MPRFHFHIRSARGALVRDEAGMYLPDIDAARAEARQIAEETSAEYGRGGRDCSGSHFEIVSADGQQTITVPILGLNHEQSSCD
jgi:hypothetical protein